MSGPSVCLSAACCAPRRAPASRRYVVPPTTTCGQVSDVTGYITTSCLNNPLGVTGRPPPTRSAAGLVAPALIAARPGVHNQRSVALSFQK
jgi:hypothetical protein